MYCQNGKLSTTTPEQAPYEELHYSIGFAKGSWKDVTDNPMKAYAGLSKITKIGGEGDADEVVYRKGSDNATQLPNEGDNGGTGGEAKNHTGCYSQLFIGTLPDPIRSYTKLNPNQKKEVDKIIKEGAKITSAKVAPGADAGCDADFTSPVAWIMCPIIEGVADATDFMFDELITPMLTNVPISTSPDDRSYKTWLGFRFIANILLVGAMLILVYGIVRSGR